jgi:prepilin-type processing-associated H-X9-DG protein
MIFDTENSLIVAPCGTTNWYSGGMFGLDPKHLGGTNILFADGHVKLEKLPFEPAKNMPFAWCRTGERNN